MIKGKIDGLQVLKDGSVKLTVTIQQEDLAEAINLHELFISADMPEKEPNAEEVRKRCMEALDKAMGYIRGETTEPASLDFFTTGEKDARNSG